ncbi:MAG: UDP-N-acetylmuramyl-tripeptide synthetase, partial [Candidatus Eremiobacteraeota bacterium]|nr:UDP-N-acetylmuramyl-tripeptide synthetase [Candidatus Eremiobacteraeota bacterium]
MIAGSPARTARLEDLIAGMPDARLVGDARASVLGLAHDSRGVLPGSVFVALRGERADGHAFLAQAAAAGAAALVMDAAFARSGAARPALTTIVVPDTRRALSALAAAFYGHPSATLDVVGVTGTNGKTTTTYLIQAILEAAGVRAGRIGTLGAAFGATLQPLANTTPLSLELQSMLASMLERGARAVAMEVSSHALALDRVADVRFALGVLTNVTRDHLDFHATFDEYAAVKRRLFASAERAVLNSDDAYGRRWAAELIAEGRVPLTYGISADADVGATDVVARPGGSEFSVSGRRFELALPGRFNVYNALAALCVAREMGVDDACSARAFAQFE